MKKQDYKKPTMEVCPLVMNQPILQSSIEGGPSGSEDKDQNPYHGGW